MKNTIEINGKQFSIEELNELIEKSKDNNHLKEVFDYHNTTQEKFDKQYEGIPLYVKGHSLECMVVAFYNKGLEPDFNDGEPKYYPYFDMKKRASFVDGSWVSSSTYVSSRQLYLGPNAKKNMLEAVVKYADVYKMSRQW